MPTITESDVIAGVMHVTPDVHGDDRGFFVETYRRSWFPLGREMVQGNRGDRQQGAVVGLHYHLHQADYWYFPNGSHVWCSTTSAWADPPTAPPSPSTSERPPASVRTTRACSSHQAWPTASPPSPT